MIRILLLCVLLLGCASAKTPLHNTGTSSDSHVMYASTLHLAFSNWGWLNGVQEHEREKAEQEGWWGLIAR